MKSRWNVYRNSLDCLERDANNREEIMAYNTKTEFTKYIFLFFINLLEWVSLIAAALTFIPNLILEYDVDAINGEYLANSSDDKDLNDQKAKIRYFISSLQFGSWSICCLILSLVLNASLCMYLAARQAKLST